ncbi:ABC transporter permease [Bacillus dakarensis]|uniref:ABC transporter permease n=1 Tax=Robertmurraya dakarensis TaxID=1926278 RepID=UPI0009814D4A|nr:ABC transporter permease [Bacillus dakarensis]
MEPTVKKANYYFPEKEKRKRKSPEWEAFKKNKLGVASLVILIIFCLIAIFAPMLMPYDPLAQDMLNRLAGPSADHWLGVDPNGRDILSRIILGSRTSLIVGFGAVLVSSLIGFGIGMIAGYKGGRLDDIVMRFLDSIMSIPLLLFGVMVVVALNSSMLTLIIAIGIGLVPGCARVARGSTMELKEKEFIKSAISMGASDIRILLTHILPNITGALLVISTLHMTTVIMVEASLSFLGVGIQPPTPTWGNMIQDGFNFVRDQPGIAIYPGIALIIVSVSFNVLGDAIRDAVDPHIKKQRN